MLRTISQFISAVITMCTLWSPSLAAAADNGSVFSQLKLFRNYSYVKEVQPQMHHFKLWYHAVEPFYCLVSAESLQALSNANGIVSESCAYGPFQAPTNPEPIPEAVADIAKAIEQRMRKQEPELKNFTIVYVGQYSIIQLGEIMPTSNAREPQSRSAITSTEMGFRLEGSGDDVQLVSVPMGGFSNASWGFSALCRVVDSDLLCRSKPQFIDYNLPEDLQGSSVLAGILKNNPRYREPGKVFARAVQATLAELEKNEYQSPIEKLLAEQGTSTLPDNFQQSVKTEISIHQIQVEGNRQPEPETRTIPIILNSKEIAAGLVRREITDQESGVKIKLSLDFTKMKAEVVFIGDETITANCKIVGKLIRDRSQPETAAVTMLGIEQEGEFDIMAFLKSHGKQWTVSLDTSLVSMSAYPSL